MAATGGGEKSICLFNSSFVDTFRPCYVRAKERTLTYIGSTILAFSNVDLRKLLRDIHRIESSMYIVHRTHCRRTHSRARTTSGASRACARGGKLRKIWRVWVSECYAAERRRAENVVTYVRAKRADARTRAALRLWRKKTWTSTDVDGERRKQTKFPYRWDFFLPKGNIHVRPTTHTNNNRKQATRTVCAIKTAKNYVHFRFTSQSGNRLKPTSRCPQLSFNFAASTLPFAPISRYFLRFSSQNSIKMFGTQK